MTKIPPWSYSTLTAYETCPLKYYVSKVSKEFPEQQTEATMWGNRVHKALEHRLAKKTPLPEGMQQWEPLAAIFDEPKGRLMVEEKFALGQDFIKAPWDNCWVRGIIDVAVQRLTTAKAYDWKTGKVKPDSHQLMLSAAAIMHLYPDINKVTTGFIWLADGSMTEVTFTRDQLPDIWEEFLPRVRRWELAYENDKWTPKPSGLCGGWCPNKRCNFYKEKK